MVLIQCLLLQIIHPLSVSYNKLGDLEYGMGNIEAGVKWYKQGLALREESVTRSSHAGPGEQLDVAVSTIKVADACQVWCPEASVQHDHR